MRRKPNAFLHCLLLLGFATRLVFGAPCCLPDGEEHGAAEMAPVMAMAMHSMPQGAGEHGYGHGHAAPEASSHDGHEGHGDDNRAKPCCSACGPMLPASPAFVAAGSVQLAEYSAQRLHDLAPSQLVSAYRARAPPERV